MDALRRALRALGRRSARARAARAPALGLLGAALAGCYMPLGGSGSERALAAYREDHARAVVLEVHQRGGKAEGQGRRAGGRLPASGALTVEQAVVAAQENSPRMQEMRARAEAARAAIDAWSHMANPELRIQQGRLDQYLNGQPRLGTAVRVKPLRPGEADAEAEVTRAEEVTVVAEARAEALLIEADVRWLFDELGLLTAEIAAADAVSAARKEISARVQERLAASMATSLDEAVAALSAAEAEQDGVGHRVRLAAVRGEILERVGLDPEASVQLMAGDVTRWPPPPLPSENVLVEAALRDRVEVATAAAQIDATHAMEFIEKRRRWPWFTFVEVGYQFAPSVESGRGWTFELGLELPVFNTQRSQASAAEASSRAAKSALVAQVKQVAREVRTCLREVEAAEKLVTAFRERVLPAAERAEAAAQKALAGQGIDAVEALSTREQQRSAEQKLLELLRRYLEGVNELRRAVGGHLPGGAEAK